MNENKWFNLGASLFSVTFGFLIGASNSPVVGAVITSLFGVAVAVISLFGKEDEGKKSVLWIHAINKGLVGRLLFFFSIFFIMGTFLGESYRTGNFFFSQAKKNFVWRTGMTPQETKEALDWIMVYEKLKAIGYTESQVAELYAIRSQELQLFDSLQQVAEEDPYANRYDASQPFHAILNVESVKREHSRGPAGEIEP